MLPASHRLQRGDRVLPTLSLDATAACAPPCALPAGIPSHPIPAVRSSRFTSSQLARLIILRPPNKMCARRRVAAVPISPNPHIPETPNSRFHLSIKPFCGGFVAVCFRFVWPFRFAFGSTSTPCPTPTPTPTANATPSDSDCDSSNSHFG